MYFLKSLQGWWSYFIDAGYRTETCKKRHTEAHIIQLTLNVIVETFMNNYIQKLESQPVESQPVTQKEKICLGAMLNVCTRDEEILMF